jgi:hypothetical protein
MAWIHRPSLYIILFLLHCASAYFFINPNIVLSANSENDRIFLQFLAKSKPGYSFIEISWNSNWINSTLFLFYDRRIHSSRPNNTRILLDHQHEERITYNEMISGITVNYTQYLIGRPTDVLWVRFGFRTTKPANFTQNPFLGSEMVQLNFSSSNISSERFEEPLILNRIENIRIAWFCVALIPYIGNFVLILLFFKKQPLKSRGIFPLFGSLLLLIHFGVGVLPTYILDYIQIEKSECYIYYLVQQVCMFSMVGFYILQYARFITMFHLSIKKEIWYETDKVQKIPLYFRIVKLVGTLQGQLVIMVVIVGFNFGIAAAFIWGTNCNVTYMRILLVVVVGLMGCTYIVLLIYDIILCIPTIRKWGLLSLVKRDGFYLRIEFIGIVCGGIPLTVLGQIVAYFFDLSVGSSVRWPLILSLGIINSCLFNYVYFCTCGFPVYLTVLIWCRSLCRKKRKVTKLDFILESQEGLKLFEKYAISEFSPENIWLRKEILDFRKNPTLEHAEKIYATYLNGSDSELEVNVTLYERKLISNRIQCGEISQDLFDSILSDVYVNLFETYSRFVVSRDYKSFQRKSDFFNELTTPLMELN